MTISEYLNHCSMNLARAKKLSRLIDIYPNLFAEYSEDMVKPLTQEMASLSQFIVTFEALVPYMDELRILNSQLKLIGLMEKYQHEYIKTEFFQVTKKKIIKAVLSLCN